MAQKVIKVGSTVMVQGPLSMDPVRSAKVISIDRTRHPHAKYGGRAVLSIPFSERECSVIVLSENQWCYGSQIVDVLD